MLEWLKKWSGALFLAWNKQMRLRLPESMRFANKGESRSCEMAAFVLLGGLMATVVTIPALLAGLVFTTFGGALIFGVLAWVVWLFHDHGRGDGLISARIAAYLPGKEMPYHLAIPVIMMILKLALLMALFACGRAWMLTLIWAGSFALEVLLLKDAGFSPPVTDFSGDATRRFWVVMSVILVINFLLSPLSSALAALFFAILWKVVRERLGNAPNLIDEIRCSGAVANWVLLLCGVLAI